MITTEIANPSEKITPDQARIWDRWFHRVKRRFNSVLKRFAGEPIVYVEIGCWAGASAEFVARNILTHPDSIGIGIDPYWPDDVKPDHPVEAIRQYAIDRLSFAGDRWLWMRAPSNDGLRQLHSMITEAPASPIYQRKIDALYIDGAHWAHNVIEDFVLAWPMLKPGSVVIFDDYRVQKPKNHPHVKEAYQAIVKCWPGLVRELGEPYRQGYLEVV